MGLEAEAALVMVSVPPGDAAQHQMGMGRVWDVLETHWWAYPQPRVVQHSRAVAESLPCFFA